MHKTMARNTIKFALTVASALILPWGRCFAHIPPKTYLGALGGGASGLSSSSSSSSTRGVGPRLSSSDKASDESIMPLSQLESIVVNARSNGRKMNLMDPTLRSHYLTAMTAGLAISLAMVPEAVSFSCEYQRILASFRLIRVSFHSLLLLITVAVVAGVSPLVGLWTRPAVLGDVLGTVPPDPHGHRNGSPTRCMFFCR